MRYISTRGDAPALDFGEVVLAGLATDGGLYLPERWPRLTAAQLDGFRGMAWTDVAVEVMAPFVTPTLSRAELTELVVASAATFTHPDVTPLSQVDETTWLLELFHGPTLAFKDVALQLLGRLFDHLLRQRGARATILGATSGDTGSAAIAGCRGRDALDIFILHPHERTSAIQRRQMTTVLDDNVHNIALRGTFDDCQDTVKALFRDPACRAELGLSAINSINWARVMAQIVYYVTAWARLGGPEAGVTFVVPTGNFGDVFAGWCAHRCGLPIARLVVATNENDILARFFSTGTYAMGGVRPTLSPSMDIQISSNFERLLFEMFDRDPAAVTARMAALREDGAFDVPADRLADAQRLFCAERVDDALTLETIAAEHARTGRLLDPHTAVAMAARRRLRVPGPVVVLATAHPAKFPGAVRRAIGAPPPAPSALEGLESLPERLAVLDVDRRAVERFIRARAVRP